MPLIAPPPPPAAGALLARLHAINAADGYLSRDALQAAAQDLGVPLSRLYSAASFYASFRFQPRGRHTVRVCLGTACYIRGGDRVLSKLERVLGVRVGQTTADGRFTLDTVHCVGSCSMSPVMRVADDTYGRLKLSRLDRILNAYESEEKIE